MGSVQYAPPIQRKALEGILYLPLEIESFYYIFNSTGVRATIIFHGYFPVLNEIIPNCLICRIFKIGCILNPGCSPDSRPYTWGNVGDAKEVIKRYYC